VDASTFAFPLVQTADEFSAATRDGLRMMRRSLEPLEKREARVLDDLNRDRGIAMVRQALEIARYRSKCPADATALTEKWHGFVLAGHQQACPVIDAFEWETKAQGEFDLAQLEYAANPTEANRQRAIEFGHRHQAYIRRCLDALHGVRR
jgi:hypothetical protein